MAASFSLPEGSLDRLCRVDPALGEVIRRVGPCTLNPGRAESALDALVRSIVSQQLSGKAAATIYGRLRALFPRTSFPSAGVILAVEEERFRACGLSRQKLTYLRALCEQVRKGALDLDALASLSDEEVIHALTQVRGLGRWTAQMFLIFHLGRLDVWPAEDLGVRRGLALIRGHRSPLTPGEVRKHGERYRPYRSVAAWYLWRAAEE
ncbi:MAG: DNA-3-methyladenine glycosylase [Myxococcales bacterium]|nr:DNA-3-methyladenine glycosylase [Myxococcales bacterium]